MEAKKKKMNARKLRYVNYTNVIEILVPIRFYWVEDGEFDGMEIGPYNKKISRYQLGLIDEVLSLISELMGGEPVNNKTTKRNRKITIPDVFLDAFKDNDKEAV